MADFLPANQLGYMSEILDGLTREKKMFLKLPYKAQYF